MPVSWELVGLERGGLLGITEKPGERTLRIWGSSSSADLASGVLEHGIRSTVGLVQWVSKVYLSVCGSDSGTLTNSSSLTLTHQWIFIDLMVSQALTER